jgi:hypothetical protein
LSSYSDFSIPNSKTFEPVVHQSSSYEEVMKKIKEENLKVRLMEEKLAKQCKETKLNGEVLEE